MFVNSTAAKTPTTGVGNSLQLVKKMREVPGFNPNDFAVCYNDKDGEPVSRISSIGLKAWFLCYYKSKGLTPKISFPVAEKCGNGWRVTCRVYSDKSDTLDCFVGEATCVKFPDPNKTEKESKVLECAQAHAVADAIRNSGFGLQFKLRSEDGEIPFNPVEASSTSLKCISKLKKVEGFNPEDFVQIYQNENSTSFIKRISAAGLRAWYSLYYDEPKIAYPLLTEQENGSWLCKARVYESKNDAPDEFISEALALVRPTNNEKITCPEWAQTAATAIALRNAGFGLQYQMAGDENISLICGTTQNATIPPAQSVQPAQASPVPVQANPSQPVQTIPSLVGDNPTQWNLNGISAKDLSSEQMMAILAQVVPIGFAKGRTFDSLLRNRQVSALKWLAGVESQCGNYARLCLELVGA